ncbi:MAG: beta-N-acetylhexosaminidase [Longimicrobiales bacterium]|nr:beta-N-acetylhexosaminidase [Longimicrobiales bacterium]
MRRPLCALSVLFVLQACERKVPHSIVPEPVDVRPASGTYRLSAATGITLADPEDGELARVADVWAEPYRRGTGLPLPVGDASEGIHLAVDPGASEVGPEGYRLEVASSGISIVGSDHAGVFYGLQSLAQLLPPGLEPGDATVPAEGVAVDAVTVLDEPRFSYRGMHLDVARHFFDVEFVKRYIDLMARYKLNRFHWHLTEDQGWRIEIDAFPRLTEVGAWRDETHVGHGREPFRGDGRRHGGYYTKEEIREVVTYAADRHVMVIPEIEMPGHATAALASYPELACTDGPFEVARTWGVFEDIFCPYEETFDFLETVLDEVVELFPGEYVHVGGDETPTSRWEESDYVRGLMFRQGLNDVEQVHGWFLRRIANHLAERGKRVIGWDEILETSRSLPPNVTVMSWRGTVGGIEASRRGHDVVMTPTSHVYFDYYQSEDQEGEPLAIGGFLPLDTVYAFEPVPGPLRERDESRIIGAQANVWTEYMKTPDQVEYMVFPRMLALAEVVWTPRNGKNFRDFRRRLDWHLRRLDAMDVRYRPPEG